VIAITARDSVRMGQGKREYSQRRLEKATKHVSALWFPINPTVLSEIREAFEQRTYESNPGKLLDDLKRDFALFTFLVKELSRIATDERLDPAIILNPVELIRWAGPTRIHAIIARDNSLPQNHMFHALEPFQAERLRETAIIASTAEVLSESHNLDPTTGFCHGVVREIGLNLIAWNYPTLFSRVLNDLGPESSLDERLAEELGFSPALLAMRVLSPLNTGDAPELLAKQDAFATYNQLCEIGEALARAERPGTYPSAENDWKLASEYLRRTVGDRGVDLVKTRAIENSNQYQKALSPLFKSLEEFSPQKKVEDYSKRTSIRRNKWLSQCSPEVRRALKSLYGEMHDIQSARRVLESLLHTIIPQAGFTGGCVFVVDPAVMALMPRAIFGNIVLRAVERIALRNTLGSKSTPFDCEVIESSCVDGDLAATALSCAQPVIEHHDENHQRALTGMYGSLGDSKRIGVLYLEAHEPATIAEEQQALSTFKAVRQALADALHLE
jgi:hypothetical protein